ncbi:2-oxo acid dehydrogenase subunit E2 [Boseongicola aestuarii]|uniref:Dihydrolipoyllysine-residue acetyltransferase component of pyruvate dehydrogenase complex n=1 Tax=Boseongicola aestuarii TaxID=1470561 RepID=A0A238IZK2_9RHOB|nr:2-oxo acid dehydrogenase subunit E2 [Boseongicola aestuarii]SMX23817.1 Dihydrolipoyllysine-residue acetyltransferase component of pyruvate dehydrogenase complex [Boseongicola aestuarii]
MAAIASPSVRKLAADRGVDIDALAAELGRETIAREDVLGQTAPRGGRAVTSSSGYWDVDHGDWGPVTVEPLNRMAKVASANLTAAQQLIPAVTHHDSADVSRLEATRKALKAEGMSVTALAFHVAVLARCLREFPRFNASLSPDGESLILKGYVHIGIAVDTPHGLAVPVLRDSDKMRLSQIGGAIRDLAGRARDRKLRGHEMGGASMTITNLGGIGGEAFTPIVNPPEVAILGITRTDIRPVWDGTAFRPVPMTPLDLSYDHRVINGADAARFLTRYCELLAQPDDLLVG